MSKPTEEVYVVQVEIGHKADFRSEILPNGFTHDWTVFVRSVDGAKIENFIEKIVFHLHPSFKDPKRVLTEPPYEISESGYAGFILKIDLYLKNKSGQGPRKIHFDYDLYLNGEEMPAINSCRLEKLKFHKPVEDFKQKLLAGGAIVIGGSAPPPSAPQSFTDLFGQPIKTSTVDSPKKSKHKDKDKERSNKGKPSPPSSMPEKEIRSEQPTARSTSFVGKDISNTSSSKDSSSKDKDSSSKDKDSSSKDKDSSSKDKDSSSKDKDSSSKDKDSSSKDKEMGSQKESTSKDKGSEHRHNLSSQSSVKDRDGSVSNKSGSLSSLHKDTSKKSSSSSHSSKSSSKDRSSKSSSRDTKKDSSKEGHKDSHKHKDKDKISRDKDSSGISATVKQTSEPSSQDESLEVRKKKSESSFSKHQKNTTHHKSSSSGTTSKGLSKEHRKSDHKHSSSTDKKSKREDKQSVQKPSAESEYKQSMLPKVLKEKSSPSVSHREKNKVSDSKKRSRSSSESSEVSSESSLHFTDEEEHDKGIDVDHLINICGDSDDGKGNVRESSKESNSSHRLTSPSASPPPRLSSNSSVAKVSPNRSTSAKQNRHQSPHVNKDAAPASQKIHKEHKELGKKSVPVKEPKKETIEVVKNKKSSPPPKRSPPPKSSPPPRRSPPPKRSPEAVVTDHAPAKEKTQKTPAASKPVKRKRDSSEEEGEITDSSLSLSSDSEVEDGGSSKSPSAKPPEITSNAKTEDGEEKEEDMEEEHNPAHSSEELRSEPVVNGKSPTQINGKVWLASDLADNGYTLGLLLKIQVKIDCLKEVNLLQEIVDLVSEAGHLKCEGGFYKFDLCNLDKELVDEVVNIMQKELGPRDLWCN